MLGAGRASPSRGSTETRAGAHDAGGGGGMLGAPLARGASGASPRPPVVALPESAPSEASPSSSPFAASSSEDDESSSDSALEWPRALRLRVPDRALPPPP